MQIRQELQVYNHIIYNLIDKANFFIICGYVTASKILFLCMQHGEKKIVDFLFCLAFLLFLTLIQKSPYHEMRD